LTRRLAHNLLATTTWGLERAEAMNLGGTNAATFAKINLRRLCNTGNQRDLRENAGEERQMRA
jgi:hypothetical protein